MSTDTLELPPIDADMIDKPPAATTVATAAAQAVEPAKAPDLQEIALAQFGDWRESVHKAKTTLAGLVLDLSTQAKVDEAKSLRWRLIGQPRAEARKTAKELKSKLSKVSKAIAAEEEIIVGSFDYAEQLITPLIAARESELEAEREAKAAKERERIAILEARYAALSTWIDRCKMPGMTAERIANGIAMLEGQEIGDDWQEYKTKAWERANEVLGVMKDLRDQAVQREAEAARLEAQRLENERIAAEQAERQAALDAQAAALAAQERQSRAVTRFGAALAAAIARVGIGRVTEVLPDVGARTDLLTADEMEAHAAALDALQQAEPEARFFAGGVHAPVGGPIFSESSDFGVIAIDSTITQDAQESGSGPAAHADESAAEPDYDALEAELVDGPASLETSDAVHIKAEDLPTLAPAPAEPQSTILLCWELLQVLKTPYAGRFPSHPKPGPEWWADVRSRIEALEPRLAKMVGAN